MGHPRKPAQVGHALRDDTSTYPSALLLITLAFTISRVLAYRCGVRFDTQGLIWYFQFLDVDLLRTELARSLYYLHMQPPLFNLFLGMVLKLRLCEPTAFFAFTYQLMGLVMAFSLYGLMRRLDVRSTVSLVLTIIFMVSPEAILFENYLFYTFPVATLVILSALFLHRYVTTGRFHTGLGFFTLLAATVLTRSLFHLFWFIVIVIILLGVVPHLRRRTLAVATLPLLAVFAWYLKNLLVFCAFTSSTWLGMSIWKSATYRLPIELKTRLVQTGELSSLAKVAPFSPLSEYHKVIPTVPSVGVAALDRELKRSGFQNLNHIQYIEISKRHQQDAMILLRRYPQGRLLAFARALMWYFVPASDYFMLDDNRRHIDIWAQFYDTMFFWQFGDTTGQNDSSNKSPARPIDQVLLMGLALAVVLPILWVYGCVLIRRLWRADSARLADLVTLGFICFTIAYVTITGNLIELGENMRFRFSVDPLYVILLGLLSTGLLDYLQSCSDSNLDSSGEEKGKQEASW